METMALETSIRLRSESAESPVGGELPVSSPPGFGRVTLRAGVEDTLAAVRTAVLLARTFGATLHLHVSGMESLEIHFGQAHCEGLLAGLVGLLRERLLHLNSPSQRGFQVEIDFSGLPAFSLFIHRAEALEMK